MRKLLSFFAYFILLIVFESLGAEPFLPADASVELSEPTKYVALTFDDGPKRSTTPLLLDGLLERGASATFFLVGEEIPGNEDLVLRMQREGHQIGNHTWGHVRLEGKDITAHLEQIRKTEALLIEITGESEHWLRPPYGLIDEATAQKITVPMVKWSVDPEDWKSRNTEKAVDAILGAVKPGDIILLHDIYPTSVEAALQVIDRLERQGYQFVTVEELLQLNGIPPENGKLIRSAKG